MVPLLSQDVRTAVVHVEVDTQPDGALLVRWELEGAPVAVDIATGPTPGTPAHRRHHLV